MWPGGSPTHGTILDFVNAASGNNSNIRLRRGSKSRQTKHAHLVERPTLARRKLRE
jgi:hypothetical protein